MSNPSQPEIQLTGRVLDERYRIQSPLGQGGMGAVFCALDERLGKQVVVKIPLAELALSKTGLQRFEAEIESLIKLDHASIVSVLDKGDVNGVPYVVLKFFGGGSLDDRLRKLGGRMGSLKVSRWLSPIARALDFLHRNKVIHRDIKPGNILFDDQGEAFLADFGIVKALDSVQPRLTQTGVMPGSPVYMAPEAVRWDFAPPYDQYALATVVYQCLAGRFPYRAAQVSELFKLKSTRDPDPLGELVPELSPEVVACVQRGLERDPQERFPSCVEFAEAFHQCVAPAMSPRSGPSDLATQTAPGAQDPTRVLETKRTGASPSTILRARWLVPAVVVLLLTAAAIHWATRPKLRLDVQIRTTPPGVRVTHDGGQGTTPFRLAGLNSGEDYRIELSRPGYEPREAFFAPERGQPNVDFEMQPDCEGSPPAAAKWPVRTLLQRFDVDTEFQIAERFPFVAVVGPRCGADATVQFGSEIRVVDDVGASLAAPFSAATEDPLGRIGRRLESVYLRKLLQGPTNEGATSLDLLVAQRDCTLERDPQAAESVVIGDTAYFCARTAEFEYLLVVSIDPQGGLSVHYPNGESRETIGLDTWAVADFGEIVPPAGRQVVFAFAADRSWIPFLRNLKVADDSVVTVTFDRESSPTARQVAEGLSDDLSARTNWARSRQVYTIAEPISVD